VVAAIDKIPNFRSLLGVEPQDVIAGHAEPADGYFIIGANMRPVPVVAAEPDRQLCLGLA
jgi:hypothetical protein